MQRNRDHHHQQTAFKKKEYVVDELWPEEELQVKELEQRHTLLIRFVAHIPQITPTNWCVPLILPSARIRAVFSFKSCNGMNENFCLHVFFSANVFISLVKHLF